VKRVEDVARIKCLNRRHASKIAMLLKDCCGWEDTLFKQPRVNVGNGDIYTSTAKSPKIPNSIVGYYDWLYSRRNALVHGDTPKFLPSDIKAMKESYRVDLSKSFSLKLQSIESASNYYSKICEKITSDSR